MKKSFEEYYNYEDGLLLSLSTCLSVNRLNSPLDKDKHYEYIALLNRLNSLETVKQIEHDYPMADRLLSILTKDVMLNSEVSDNLSIEDLRNIWLTIKWLNEILGG